MIDPASSNSRNMIKLYSIINSSQVPRVICVHGLGRGAGTTTIAYNIAVTLAKHNLRTLLIDLDPLNTGLTREINGEALTLDEIVKQFKKSPLSFQLLAERCLQLSSHLTFMPALGCSLLNTLPASMTWQFMSELFMTARGYVDYIVADLGSTTAAKYSNFNYDSYSVSPAPRATAQLAALETATKELNIFGENESFENWRTSKSQWKFSKKSILIVNRRSVPNLFQIMFTTLPLPSGVLNFSEIKSPPTRGILTLDSKEVSALCKKL